MDFHIDDEEVLKPGLWAELVKIRAGRFCEAASDNDPCSGRLESHHIGLNGKEGDHRLANGRCLCKKHHRRVHRDAPLPWKCDACGEAMNTGNLTQHQAATGHVGKTQLSPV